MNLVFRCILGAILLFVGSWFLLYGERLQLKLTAHHESLKRTRHASNLWLKVTSVNYELAMRSFGGLLIILFLVLVVLTGINLENYR